MAQSWVDEIISLSMKYDASYDSNRDKADAEQIFPKADIHQLLISVPIVEWHSTFWISLVSVTYIIRC